jgi:NADPH:quinone reductase-like Zn-dependent oxidoreductase
MRKKIIYVIGERNMSKKCMAAVLLTGHGGFETLEYRTDVLIPLPKPGEVLIRVAAAGVNNTDINTRIGWYSKSITGPTGTGKHVAETSDDADWSGKALSFPRIQGADVCGRIVEVGENVNSTRIGERVLVRNMLRSYVDYRPFECWTLGSDCDGGFAQYVVAPTLETHEVRCDWSDAELASVPCAFSTAENMLRRANVGAERVLVTGASGGVGSAAVQLLKRRGAEVVAVASSAKAEAVLALGADQVVDRNVDLVAAVGRESIDVVLDLVGGEQWPSFFDLLNRGGRYAVAGAIAGPLAQIDLRTIYLKDLTLFGCTFQEDAVFTNLINYIDAGEIRPVVAKTYPLSEIRQAQEDFMQKSHIGKLVLVP